MVRLFIAIGFIMFSFYLSTGVSGKALQGDLDSYLPPHDYAVTQPLKPTESIAKKAVHEEENWIEDIDLAYEEAKNKQQLLFVDFTGKTCTNCRWMEKNMFVHPEIQPELGKYIPVRLWTDYGEKKEEYQQLQMKLFNSVALPFYAIMDSEGNVVKSFSGMTRSVEEFKTFLK